MPYSKKLPKILSTTFVPFKVRYGYYFSGSTQYKMSSVFYRQLQCGALSDGFLQGFPRYLLLFLLSQHRDTKFSLQISLPHETLIFQHQKRNFVSPSGHVMFDLLHVNTTEMPNHKHFLWCERHVL